MPRLYLDDPEAGLARATSHPAFVQLAQADFYFDQADDFGPFGSDDGFDALSALQDWFRDGGQAGGVMAFLQQLLADWDLPVPADVLTQSDEASNAWLKQGSNDMWLASVCRARVATAFGQIKVSGQLDADVREQALLALDKQLLLNQRARRVYPDWEFADLEAERLHTMRMDLSRFHTL
jgi:uncharacterized protein YfeS